MILQKCFIKVFKDFIILSIYLFYFTINIFSQATGIEVQRSNEKVFINGKVFYIHIVKKGETLFSIAKAYIVTVSDITTANPDAVVEIKIDQVLRIPVATMRKEEVIVKKNDEQIIHIVAMGQTLYSISRIYGVSVAEIEKLNPEVKIDSLQINQVLKIPVSKKEITENQDNLKAGFIIHKVKEKETIFSLSKQYRLSQDSLFKYNKSLAREGLKAGQDIIIPVNNENTPTETVKVDTSSEIKKEVLHSPTVMVKVDSSTEIKKEVLPFISFVNCDSLPKSINEKNLQVSLLLPLFSSGTYTSDVESNDESHTDEKIQLKQPDEFSPISVNFIEFYQGVILAMEDIKNKGIQINLYVFDTEKGASRITEILKDQNFQKSNLIIGPVFDDQIKIVSEYAAKNGINLVAPINCNDKLLSGNASIFSVNPGKTYEIAADINLLRPDTSKNTLVIYKADSINTGAYGEFKKALAKKLGKDTAFIKSVFVFKNDFSIVKSSIDSLHENIVISPVIDEIFVTNLLGTLESKLIDNRISVVGMRDWISYSGIDLNYFYDLQMTYNTPFYIDYNDINVKKFLKNYRLFFGTEPVKDSKYGFNYAMLGYDISNFFVNAYYSYGKEFSKYICCSKNKGIAASFKFSKVSSSEGYSNIFLHSVKYNKDYTIQVDTSTNK
jgi:LysM repeat protein/ABC-type branched-subunit amino acid transport system substrate-binding protein